MGRATITSLRCVAALIATAALAGATGIFPAVGQQWPSKPITAVLPFGPGTALEAVARPLFDPMSKRLGQPIVIEHRPGGGGIVAADHVARSAPDGHTLLLYSSSFSIAHTIHSKRPYDTLNDFTPVVPFGIQPNVLVTTPDRGFKTLADLISAAKEKPGAMNYASIGPGSVPHLAAERLRLSAGFEAQHIPFRGPPAALAEVVAGRVDFYYIPLGSALPLIRDGKLVPLAVSTAKRATALPDVPTTIELGLKDSAFHFWIGLFAPSKTPNGVVEKLHAETQHALSLPDVHKRMNVLGMEPMNMTPAEFAEYFRKDIEEVADLVKRAGIKVN